MFNYARTDTFDDANTVKSFPTVATVKAYMLLRFTKAIHTRDNPIIANGETITLIGRSDKATYMFKTDGGLVGHCTANAFQVVCHE